VTCTRFSLLSSTHSRIGAEAASTGSSSRQLPVVVAFVRHGRTPTTGTILPGRAPGLHLSEEGGRQASEVAEMLAKEVASLGERGPRVGAVYASPMERAKETARPIARALGLRVATKRSLIECDFGAWTGAKLAELAKLPEWKRLMADPVGFSFPGGESILQVQERIVGFAEEVRESHPGELVVAVSHADVIRVAIASALGAPLSAMHRIWVSTASVSVVSYGHKGVSVLALNASGDLSGIGSVFR
jgi:broad specificity phosphatase PhoE